MPLSRPPMFSRPDASGVLWVIALALWVGGGVLGDLACSRHSAMLGTISFVAIILGIYRAIWSEDSIDPC